MHEILIANTGHQKIKLFEDEKWTKLNTHTYTATVAVAEAVTLFHMNGKWNYQKLGIWHPSSVIFYSPHYQDIFNLKTLWMNEICFFFDIAEDDKHSTGQQWTRPIFWKVFSLILFAWKTNFGNRTIQSKIGVFNICISNNLLYKKSLLLLYNYYQS